MRPRHLAAAMLAIATLTMTAASAQQTSSYVFRNPCDRGPVPTWELINSARQEFANFLQQVRPAMPRDVAEYIASELCDDMSIVGDNDALTRRTRLLIQQAGY